ncbi:hypothetical protein [Bacillus sp. Hm123]|uniref:hypothetical protein n=1 Tax=Bacillus sp. Hm123 TaxID=3450745 RepID=UPI003F442242
MSAITFLASSTPFEIPAEIQAYNDRRVFEREEDLLHLYVIDAEKYGWSGVVKGYFSLPYIYEIVGADTNLFLLYLEKYMEMGDVLELLHMPNQHNEDYYLEKIERNPSDIYINVGSLTYQNEYMTYRLDPENWKVELSNKTYLTEHGITKIVKY